MGVCVYTCVCVCDCDCSRLNIMHRFMLQVIVKSIAAQTSYTTYCPSLSFPLSPSFIYQFFFFFFFFFFFVEHQSTGKIVIWCLLFIIANVYNQSVFFLFSSLLVFVLSACMVCAFICLLKVKYLIFLPFYPVCHVRVKIMLASLNLIKYRSECAHVASCVCGWSKLGKR